MVKNVTLCFALENITHGPENMCGLGMLVYSTAEYVVPAWVAILEYLSLCILHMVRLDGCKGSREAIMYMHQVICASISN